MHRADDVGADVDVDVEEPEELLLDPVEPDLAVPPEQWEVLADEPAAVVDQPPAPPVAVPVLRHIVEAPVFDPAPMPEPEPEPEPEAEAEQEPDFEVVAPVTTPRTEPAPAPAPAPLVAERVPPAERATSAMVLLLLAVVVGIALAGLVSAVVLVLTLLVRRALGS
jgi:hypothetical protein